MESDGEQPVAFYFYSVSHLCCINVIVEKQAR
ncbi:hypothetical protein GGD38_007466 [Chitinophagaceae bacterium OAS944]|nr:hypothetical protein [Chitinophagaceae bacterium OAS944]